MDDKCLDEALLKNDFVPEPRSDGLRWWLSPKGMNRVAELSRLRDVFLAARDKAKRDAINNLARYKFSNFGYHAARWVTLNQLIGDKQPNPFVDLVKEPHAKFPVQSGTEADDPPPPHPENQAVPGVRKELL